MAVPGSAYTVETDQASTIGKDRHEAAGNVRSGDDPGESYYFTLEWREIQGAGKGAESSIEKLSVSDQDGKTVLAFDGKWTAQASTTKEKSILAALENSYGRTKAPTMEPTIANRIKAMKAERAADREKDDDRG